MEAERGALIADGVSMTESQGGSLLGEIRAEGVNSHAKKLRKSVRSAWLARGGAAFRHAHRLRGRAVGGGETPRAAWVCGVSYSKPAVGKQLCRGKSRMHGLQAEL